MANDNKLCKPCCQRENTSLDACSTNPGLELRDLVKIHHERRCVNNRCKECFSYGGFNECFDVPVEDKDDHTVVVGSSSGPIAHCPINLQKFKCRPGSGERIFNTGNSDARVWNPDDEVSVGGDGGWECLPCCIRPGYSIDQCPS